MDTFGLDIGPATIKLVQLQKDKTVLKLLAVGEVPSPVSSVSQATDSQLAQIAATVKKLVSDSGVKSKNVVFSLPEAEVTSRLTQFPAMKENELKGALEFEAETFIPYPLDKAQMDYQIVKKEADGKLLVFIVAAPKLMVEKYLKIAKLSGLVTAALETQAVAMTRYLASRTDPVLLLNVGVTDSLLVVGKEGNVLLSRSLPFGTTALSRSVAVSLGLEPNVAEQYRVAYGLKKDELEGRVRNSLLPIFSRLIDEVKKTFLSFKEDWQQDIRAVAVGGIGSIMPEFSEEMAKMLGVEIQLIQPFASVKIEGPSTVDLKVEGPKFAIAFGLACRGLI
ncbi:MAG: type IV pilus assembly protein PilM [Patescibacteria group bacterium]